MTIEDIEKELEKMEIDALISRVPSADEYYQSLKIGQSSKQTNSEKDIDIFIEQKEWLWDFAGIYWCKIEHDILNCGNFELW